MLRIINIENIEIKVNIDEDDFSSDELISMLETKILSFNQIHKIKKDILNEIDHEPEISLLDKMKLDHFKHVFNDYTLREIENLLPTK